MLGSFFFHSCETTFVRFQDHCRLIFIFKFSVSDLPVWSIAPQFGGRTFPYSVRHGKIGDKFSGSSKLSFTHHGCFLLLLTLSPPQLEMRLLRPRSSEVSVSLQGSDFFLLNSSMLSRPEVLRELFLPPFALWLFKSSPPFPFFHRSFFPDGSVPRPQLLSGLCSARMNRTAWTDFLSPLFVFTFYSLTQPTLRRGPLPLIPPRRFFGFLVCYSSLPHSSLCLPFPLVTSLFSFGQEPTLRYLVLRPRFGISVPLMASSTNRWEGFSTYGFPSLCVHDPAPPQNAKFPSM